ERAGRPFGTARTAQGMARGQGQRTARRDQLDRTRDAGAPPAGPCRAPWPYGAAALSGLRFAGYAALFGERDAGRDVILPGAFARTLAARRDPLPLFWQHRADLRIGWIDR